MSVSAVDDVLAGNCDESIVAISAVKNIAASKSDQRVISTEPVEVDPNYWTTGLDREIRFEC